MQMSVSLPNLRVAQPNKYGLQAIIPRMPYKIEIGEILNMLPQKHVPTHHWFDVADCFSVYKSLCMHRSQYFKRVGTHIK